MVEVRPVTEGRLSREIRVIVLLAVSIILMLGIYFYLHAYPSLTRLLIEESEADAVRAANVLRHIALGGLEKGIQPDAGSGGSIAATQQALGVLKIKIFDVDGRVVYSTDAVEVGRVNGNAYFRDVVAQGLNYTHFVSSDDQSLEGDSYVRDVVETYVPIVEGGKFAGAFEIYYDITARRQDLDQRLRSMNVGIASLLAVLLVVFALVVARSYRSALRSERDYSNRLHEEIELRLQTEEALRESHGRFEHMAHHDPLTGLPNRTLFLDRFEHALANARRYDTRMALLFIDLDQFKSINDNYGHETGDRILMAAADVLRRGVRASDTAARIAGDEFAVLIEHADAAMVEGVVKRMSHEFATKLEVETLEIASSASIGISFFPEDGDDLETLLHRADTAMYRSKAIKPGGWQYFSKLVAELQVMKLTPDSEAS